MRFSNIIATASLMLTASAAVVAPLVIRETDTSLATFNSEEPGEVHNMLRLMQNEGQPETLEAFNITFTKDNKVIIGPSELVDKEKAANVVADMKMAASREVARSVDEDLIKRKIHIHIHISACAWCQMLCGLGGVCNCCNNGRSCVTGGQCCLNPGAC